MQFENESVHFVFELNEAHSCPLRPPSRSLVGRSLKVNTSLDAPSRLTDVQRVPVSLEVGVYRPTTSIVEATFGFELLT